MARIAGLLSVSLAATAFASEAAAQPANYTGFWKRNCQDEVGVQITRLREKLYSFSFCNPDGCTLPGKYRPNSPIDGDPTYDVQSATRMRLKHDDQSYTPYQKCTSDSKPPELRKQ
jgi:hypothetical protein